MHITIASSSQAARKHLTALLEASGGENIEWLDADSFLSRLEANTQASAEDTQYVWLYAAPWSPSLSASTELPAWRPQQQRILRLRAKLDGRLRLVNLDRAEPGWVDGAAAGPALHTEGTDKASLSVLSMLFDAIAPEYWDTYETLESVSWLPTGTPELRHDVKVPSTEALMAFMAQVNNGARWDELQAAVVAQEQAAQALEGDNRALQADLDDTRRALAAAKAQADAAIAERDSRLLAAAQVEQRLTADLERQTSLYNDERQENQSLIEQLESLNQEAAQRRLMAEQDLEQLNSTIGALEKQLAEANEAHDRTRVTNAQALATAEQRASEHESESKLLLEQLHAVQEALESLHVKSMAAEEQTSADIQRLTQEAELARTALEQMTSNLDTANRKVNEQSAEHRQLLDNLKVQREAAAAAQAELESQKRAAAQISTENMQLLDQLQLVQEELEKLALARCEAEQALTALEQMRSQLDSANRKMNEQSAEHRRLLDNLKVQEEAAVAAQAELESQKGLAAQISAENTQLLDQLQLVQEELEKLFVARREDAVAAASVQQERDEALREAVAHRESMAQLESAKADQERAIAELRGNLQQEGDKARSAEADSELLLDQLHQVQEELERYYLANREYQTMIERSTSVVRRAQLSVIDSLKSQ